MAGRVPNAERMSSGASASRVSACIPAGKRPRVCACASEVSGGFSARLIASRATWVSCSYNTRSSTEGPLGSLTPRPLVT